MLSSAHKFWYAPMMNFENFVIENIQLDLIKKTGKISPLPFTPQMLYFQRHASCCFTSTFCLSSFSFIFLFFKIIFNFKYVFIILSLLQIFPDPSRSQYNNKIPQNQKSKINPPHPSLPNCGQIKSYKRTVESMCLGQLLLRESCPGVADIHTQRHSIGELIFPRPSRYKWSSSCWPLS